MIEEGDLGTLISKSDLESLEVKSEWLRVFGELTIEPPVNVAHMTCFDRCSFGTFSYTGHNCEMWNTDIGRFCSIGPGVIINPGTHPTGFLTTHPIGTSQDGHPAGLSGLASYACFSLTGMMHPVKANARSNRVRVGHDVWIGARAIIRTDVEVGTGAIIGAGSIVTSDVPPFHIVAGAPARIVRTRFPPKMIVRIEASRWWEYDLSALPTRDYSQVDKILDELELAKSRGELQLFKPKRWLLNGS